MRKTKIICTLGPATDSLEIVKSLIQEGMNVARFNFSHGTHEQHEARLKTLVQAREEMHQYVAALLDTKGPEIRVKKFARGKIELEKNQEFTLTAREVEGTNEIVSITFGDLYKDVKPGSKILIDDGLIELRVLRIIDRDIVCKVENGGPVSDSKGINVPGTTVSMPYVSPKDRSDIIFGIKQGFDFIAASFVREAADIRLLRQILEENGGQDIRIIAKIENSQGIQNIDEIIEASDGIMIARGDMGVEIPYEDVPAIQKMIIRKVYAAGKIVITATQMLDSMITHIRPTRAEVTDVANAIYDGTSAIMLSGETAAGMYPVEAVRTMAKIADKTEENIDYKTRFFMQNRQENPDITDAISHATCTTAHDLNAAAIVTVTKTGKSARMISRYRPQCSIIGCATSEKACRQLNLSWGVTPVLLEEKKDVFELFSYALDTSKEQGYLHEGEVVVITSGVPIGIAGTTNMIKVEVVL